MGPGKLTYALPVMFCFPLCYVHVLPAGGGGGSGKQKSADIEWKTVTLIYPYPTLIKSPSYVTVSWTLLW